jgi:hypothetical protein
MVIIHLSLRNAEIWFNAGCQKQFKWENLKKYAD